MSISIYTVKEHSYVPTKEQNRELLFSLFCYEASVAVVVVFQKVYIVPTPIICHGLRRGYSIWRS